MILSVSHTPAGDFVAAVVGRLVLARDVLPRGPPGAATRAAGPGRTLLTAPKGVVLLNTYVTIWLVRAEVAQADT